MNKRLPEGLRVGLGVVFLVAMTLVIAGEIGVLFFLTTNLCLAVVFLFLLIWFLTKKILCGLFSGLFFLASSGVWSSFLQEGLYSRVLAVMTICLSLLAMVIYFSKFGQKKRWPYWLVVLAFSFAFLSHFSGTVLVSLSFLVIVFFQETSWRKRIIQGLKIFLPVLGLTAFYYLPVLFQLSEQLGLISSFGRREGGGSLGLPFFGLPLAGAVLVMVWLIRHKIGKSRKINYQFFLCFGILSLICLIYPDQLLMPTAVFLSLFLGLGFYFLETLKVVNFKVLVILVFGLLIIGFNLIPKLKKQALDQTSGFKFERLVEERFFLFGSSPVVERVGLVMSLGTGIMIIKKIMKE